MNKSQKLTLIGYCSSLALILATTNLARATEVSLQDTASFSSSTAASFNKKSVDTEIIHNISQNEDQVALSTGSSEERTTDGDRCACMGYSNFCLHCHHSPGALG
jgi:sialic acid synthase SpsE